MTAERNPNETGRAMAYKLWMQAPNPMVTFFKTLDITNLIRLTKRKGLKLNMLLCWCIGKSAARKLYEKKGFLATGVEDEDEIELVLAIA